MKIKNILLALILTSLVLSGCNKNTEDKTYIETSGRKCDKIVFTCPQYQEAFFESGGCGCIKSKTTIDNPDGRTLQSLIAKYLVNVVTKPEGKVNTFTDYMVMNIANEESSKTLTYEVWAMIRKIDHSDEENPKVISEINSPIVLEIEQTGTHYIIRDHKIVDYKKASEVKTLSQKSQDYINSEEFPKHKKEIDLTLAESINVQLELLKQL